MSRNARKGENGENGEKSPASGGLNWMSKVASNSVPLGGVRVTFGIQFKSPESGDFSPFSPLQAIFAKIALFATIAGDLNWMP